jgi:hypothetical protein
MSVESFGRLGAPALTLLGGLADQAVKAGGPGLSRAAFISGALGELSVAFCRVPLAGPRCAVSPSPRLRFFRLVSRPVCGFGVFGSASLCVALRSLAMWRVCAIAPSFVSGWRASSSVSLCKFYLNRGVLGLLCALCVGLGFLVRLRFALRGLALWLVCAIAPSFVSGWWAFSSVSLCKSIYL